MSASRIVSIVIAAVVAIFGVIIMATVSDDGSNDWQYDDYRTVEGAVAASGSLEILDNGIVHAHDIGEGTISFSDGTVQEVIVHKAHLVVLLMTGQSNSTHWVTDTSQATPLPPRGVAYYYGTETEYGTTMSNLGFWSLYDEAGDLRVADKLPSFATEFYNETGKKIYWICGGWGGMAINTFTPGEPTWNWMRTAVVNGLAAIPSTHFEYELGPYMWIQGESDKENSIGAYKIDYMRMHNAILGGELGGHVFDHCYISLPRYSDSINAYDAQIELAEEHPSTITIACNLASGFTTENGLMHPGDNIHYTQAGDNLIGECLGEHVGKAVGTDEIRGATKTLVDTIPVILIAGLIFAIGYKLFTRRNTL